jgi:hypothetical protein
MNSKCIFGELGKYLHYYKMWVQFTSPCPLDHSIVKVLADFFGLHIDENYLDPPTSIPRL